MEKLKLNHDASCLCKAFNTTCERIQEMKQEMQEILARADNNSEAIELSWEAGKTFEEKVLYTFLLGKKFAELARDGGEENKEMPPIVSEIIRGIQRMQRRSRESDDE